MNPLLHLLMAALISVCLSLAVLRLLSGPLGRVLARVCPDEPAAAFWLSYTQVMLTTAPLLVTLGVDWLAGTDQPLTAFRLAVMAALVGLLVGLHAVGRRLGQFVRAPKSVAAGVGSAS